MNRKLAKIMPVLCVAALMAACGHAVASDKPAGSSIAAQASAPKTAAATQSLCAGHEKAVCALSQKNPTEQAPGPFDSGKAVIIFTFDDGHASDYLLAYPILTEFGIKGTSYINTKFTDERLKGRLSWEQIKEMSANGWVFGGHTQGHLRMTKLSDKEIRSDCEGLINSFRNQGLEPPTVMAYPYGACTSKTIEAIKPYFKQARLADNRKAFVDTASADPFKIPSVSADMQSKGKLIKAQRIVDKACDKGGILVFRVHVLYKNRPYDTVKRNPRVFGGCAPQTDAKLFAELVKYCVDKGCAFSTMTELMAYMDAQGTAR